MREAYQVELGQLAEELATMCSMSGTAMELATQALLNTDLALAEQVIGDDAKIDDARASCEEHAYEQRRLWRLPPAPARHPWHRF